MAVIWYFQLRLVVDTVLTLFMIVNVDAAFSGAEVVFHMAAPDSSINNHQLQYSVNVQGWILGHLDQLSVCVCVCEIIVSAFMQLCSLFII